MPGFIDVEELIQNPPFELSEADKEVLTTADEDFIPHTWEEFRSIVATGDTSQLRRTPTDLRNYILWTREVRATFGSATNFVVQNRLQWQLDVTKYCDSIPFGNQSDYRILRNDWPYGMTPDLTHLVIWLKAPIPVGHDGSLTFESRQLITKFVERTFAAEMMQRKYAGDNIQWFKNHTKWQSVRALEHIHVILRDADERFVTALTGQSPDDIICNSYLPSTNGA
ncbi:hypothetical protein BDV25DRAFT_145052 [Aspergillus avenaceus]|uniref:N-acetylglucosamine-induced protein 1 n=1 Tax=Aspergillus avenaceus TaxID=36643 RepID=A0A5N6TFW0_ASPAV|nr:hypothetical protein BDV25DRAFT_145052 [Aspergillus avenaceus]